MDGHGIDIFLIERLVGETCERLRSRPEPPAPSGRRSAGSERQQTWPQNRATTAHLSFTTYFCNKIGHKPFGLSDNVDLTHPRDTTAYQAKAVYVFPIANSKSNRHLARSAALKGIRVNSAIANTDAGTTCPIGRIAE